MKYDYEYCSKAADYIKSKVDFIPEIGIILGTGLGPLAEKIVDPVQIPYGEIPNFLISTAPRHAGKMILGKLSGKKVICMSGRFHQYEGYSYEDLVLPVRVLKLMGIKCLILSNACGGINLSYKVGDIMLIEDHIKMTGASPLRGPNDDEFGPRFFDVSDLYSKELRGIAKETAKQIGLDLKEGVYFFMTGPQYESAAEVRAIRILGGDVVGMSTVTEALTAAHCGLPVIGFSVVSNMATGASDQVLSSEDVEKAAARVSREFSDYIEELLKRL